MSLTTDEKSAARMQAQVLLNVPNQLTIARLVLSIALFVLSELGTRLAAPGY